MTANELAWLKGFVVKCAEYNADPVAMLKIAQDISKDPAPAGGVMGTLGGWFNKAKDALTPKKETLPPLEQDTPEGQAILARTRQDVAAEAAKNTARKNAPDYATQAQNILGSNYVDRLQRQAGVQADYDAVDKERAKAFRGWQYDAKTNRPATVTTNMWR
jgi:hypothetical protein